LCVDAKSVLSATFQVARGGVHGCALLTRDVLTPVVRQGAAGFVLVHNHPSGDPTPSREDIELTSHLSRAAQTISVPLLDHVVVARDGATSLFELGLL
jgi:DNA repair protein RadC